MKREGRALSAAERRSRRRRALGITLVIACTLVFAAGASVFGQGLTRMLGLGGAVASPPLAATTARAEAAQPEGVGRVEIPDVRGMTLVQAQAMLETAGLLVRVSVDYGAESSGEQRIRTQRPAAGSVVSASSPVDVSVPPKAGASRVSTAKKGKAPTYVVVIDPGHQSKDGPGMEPVGPGASGTVARASRGGIGKETGIPECELARQLAASLEDRLTFAGVRVIATRSTNDVDLSSAQRAEVANSAKADLLIEIHMRCEATPTGVRTYYPASNRWTKGTTRTAQRAADAIQHGVVAATGAGDAGTVAASDVVSFNWSKVPCVRVEVGSIANPVEERLLSSAKYQDRIVDGLASGITEFLAGIGDVMSAMKAALLGALAAVIVVAGVLAIAVSGVLSAGGDARSGKDGPIAVGLVLPGSDGAVALRVLDVYTREGSGWSMRSVTPSSEVVVSGTGGTTLADAYSFGGGSKLADTLESQLDQPVRAWVIVDQTAWLALRSGSPVPVDLPEQVDVFDGQALSSFPAGQGSVAPNQTGLLLDGSAFLKAVDGKIVRSQVGDALRSSLASAGPSGAGGVESNLGPSALSAWVKALGVARRVPGT